MGHDDQGDHLTPTHALILCDYPLQARCPGRIQRRQTGFVPLLMYWLGPVKPFLKVEPTRALQRNSALIAWNWSVLFERRNSRALRLQQVMNTCLVWKAYSTIVKKATSLNILRLYAINTMDSVLLNVDAWHTNSPRKTAWTCLTTWARDGKAGVEWMMSFKKRHGLAIRQPEATSLARATQQTCLCWANVGPTFVVTLDQRRTPTLDQRCFAHWAYGGPTVGANHLPTFSQCWSSVGST